MSPGEDEVIRDQAKRFGSATDVNILYNIVTATTRISGLNSSFVS